MGPDQMRHSRRLRERWFWSHLGWHFIAENGDLFHWDGSPRIALTGTLVASLSHEYWLNIERLDAAVAPGRIRARANGATVSDLDFGRVEL